MRTIEIEKQLHQRPFLPLRLCMSDGSSFDVRHPEMLMVACAIVVLAIYKLRARRPETFAFCDPVHIIRIEPMVNGRSKARRSSKR